MCMRISKAQSTTLFEAKTDSADQNTGISCIDEMFEHFYQFKVNSYFVGCEIIEYLLFIIVQSKWIKF